MFNAFISYSHAADGKLAPALQIALEKIAKPWYKLRNLNIFRDESSLSASPHLWTNIQKALDNSEYLVYMASPESANSKWVIKEIEYWLELKPLDHILIVLTEGEITWSGQDESINQPNQTSLPEILTNRLKEDPFYIDLRAAKSQEDVSLNNPLFRKEVLKLAAHLHGKAPKDMAGEEVLAHRNMIRIRNGAIAVLIGLLVFAGYQTNMARTEAANAQKQAKAAITSDSIAQVQRKIAQDSSMVAQKQRQIARDSSLVAQQQRDVAREQEKIAFTEKNKAQRELKERIKAENSFMEKAKNAEYAKLKAANAIGKWKLIEQLTQKRISAADAIIIIEAFGQGKSEYRDETFCCITDVIILKSKLSDTLYKIQLLGWNNRVSSELDLLPIPSLHNSFRGND